MQQAQPALPNDPQWTAQLCDYLLALDYEVNRVKRLKADALDELGDELLTATGRNYYFTVAKQLQQSTTHSQEVSQ